MFKYTALAFTGVAVVMAGSAYSYFATKPGGVITLGIFLAGATMIILAVKKLSSA